MFSVRRLGPDRVEVLAEDGRVVLVITGQNIELHHQPAQPTVEEIDVREIADPDVRAVADKVNEVIGVLRAASIIRPS